MQIVPTAFGVVMRLMHRPPWIVVVVLAGLDASLKSSAFDLVVVGGALDLVRRGERVNGDAP